MKPRKERKHFHIDIQFMETMYTFDVTAPGASTGHLYTQLDFH